MEIRMQQIKNELAEPKQGIGADEIDNRQNK
jgi:hypothetical protein